jgi:hypothetical protein
MFSSRIQCFAVVFVDRGKINQGRRPVARYSANNGVLSVNDEKTGE